MLPLILASAIFTAPIEPAYLVLWEAQNAGDMAIATAEPVEGFPAVECLTEAREHNAKGSTYWFCLPEGKEPTT